MEFVKPNIEKPEAGSFMVCKMPDNRTGIVKVIGSVWYTSEEEWESKPRGELSYSYSYARSFPQVIVRDACGESIRVSGNDLLEDELRTLKQEELIFQKYYEPSNLSDVLGGVLITSYNALNDPICSCCRNWSEHDVTLLDTVMRYKNSLIVSIVNSILDKPAVLYSFEEMESPGDSFCWPDAEFVVQIKNIANLYITLDGYRGDEIQLNLF